MKKLLFLTFAIFMILSSCHTKRTVPDIPEPNGIHIPRPKIVVYPETTTVEEPQAVVQPRAQQSAMPRGVVYRTSGNFDNNVFMVMGPEGQIISYPAPSDVTADSAPIRLSDGWLLDRRGIAQGAVFLTWTYSEYHDLKAVPTPEELKAHIIPGAKVTGLMTLPMTASEARSDTAAVVSFIRKNTLTLPHTN